MSSIYKLPYFEEIDLNENEEYYASEFEYRDHIISIDLNLDDIEGKISKSKLDKVKNFLDNIDTPYTNALIAIQKKYKDVENCDYFDQHLKELEASDLNQLLSKADKSLSEREQLISVLYLTTIGFYPYSNKPFATFDFTIGEDLTNWLVVVDFNNKGEIYYITEES